MDSFKSTEDLLVSLFDSEGLEILNDPVRIKGLISDYFPQKSKENYAIKACLDKGFSKKLYSAITQDNHLSQLEISQLKEICVSELWMSDEALNYVMNTFVNALRRSKYSSQIHISSLKTNNTSKESNKTQKKQTSKTTNTNKQPNPKPSNSGPTIPINTQKQSPVYSIPTYANPNSVHNSVVPTTVPNIQKSAYYLPPSPQPVATQNNTNGQSNVNSGTTAGCITFIIIIIIAIFLFRGCIGGCSNEPTMTTSTAITTTESLPRHDIVLHVECEENLLFSKYDVAVLFDNQEVGTIEHGSSSSFTGLVTEGKHTIVFHEIDYKSISGSFDIDVSGPILINVKIHCAGSQVEIKEMTTAVPTTDPLSGRIQSSRHQRNGFSISSNIELNVADYICYIPNYWSEDTTQSVHSTSSYNYVAKTDIDDSFVRLLCTVFDDPDNYVFNAIQTRKEYKEHYVKSLVKGIDASNYTILRQETVSFGDVNGLLSVFEVTIEKNGAKYKALVCSFAFPSVDTQKFIQLELVASDNAQYEYTSDFLETLNSIKKPTNYSATATPIPSPTATPTATFTPTPSPTTTPTPTPTATFTPTPSPTTTSTPTPTATFTPTPSPTDTPTLEPIKKTNSRVAFSAKNKECTAYYIIDTLERTVYYFTSSDRKAKIGTIVSGNLESGITVSYIGSTETISYYENESIIVVHDSSGNDLHFNSCGLDEAEQVME